jgi:hypothetical protein
VTCVLVAVLLTAAFSLDLSLAEYAEDQPVAKLANPKLGSFVCSLLGCLDERLNAKTIAIIFGNPKATARTIAYDPSDAADAGHNFRTLPLVDKDGATRRISGGASRGAGRGAISRLGTFSIGRRVSANEKRRASDQFVTAGVWKRGEATNECSSSPS